MIRLLQDIQLIPRDIFNAGGHYNTLREKKNLISGVYTSKNTERKGVSPQHNVLTI